jgi:hypothetical protein
MMRIWWVAFFAAVGCPGTPDDPIVDTGDDRGDPCDNDADGARNPDCGGSDCDDHDDTIGPFASDLYGDELDSDCDGSDMRLDLVAVPPGSTALDWRWSPDLRQVGGAIMIESGRIAGHTLEMGAGFGSPLIAQERVIYGDLLLSETRPRRVWDGATPVDLFVTDAGVEVWSTSLGAVVMADSAATAVDAWVSGSSMNVVACGDGHLRWAEVDLASGDVLASASQESESDICAMLSLAGEPVVLEALSSGGALTRWYVGAEGFTDYLRLASSVAPTGFVSAAHGATSAFAIALDDDTIKVFQPEGVGTVVPSTGGVNALGLSLDDAGSFGVVWVDDAGMVQVGVGPLGGSVTRVEVDPTTPPLQVGVGLTSDEVDVSIWDGDQLLLARALR